MRTLVVAVCTMAAAQVLPARAPRLPETPYRYITTDQPRAGASQFDNTPVGNPITNDGATLGRVLFYDTLLSANNSTSCSSCHVQKHAFADPNRFSRGFDGGITDRHAMNLTDLRYYLRGRFFWDERGGNLEEMVLLPVVNRIEMGEDLSRLPQKLSKTSYYPDLFRRAFGDEGITEQRIARALAQFLRSLVSYESRYDDGLDQAGSPLVHFANFTREENHGKALFVRNCATCHQQGAEQFFVLLPTNTGLDSTYRGGVDGGIGDFTLNSIDQGRFKSPSLRNVEVAGPYMHDGRLSTLEAVIDHYSHEFKPHPNIDSRMRLLNFTNSEKAALVAFLKTLTDAKFLTDPRFADPFGEPARAGEPSVAPATAPIVAATPISTRGVPIEEIVARVLAFDKNGDGSITSGELNERMQSLIASADSNGNGALDGSEIEAYSKTSSTLSFGVHRGQFVMPPIAARLVRLGNDLTALLQDLDLPRDRHQRALEIMAASDDKEPSVLVQRLGSVLTAAEFDDLNAAFQRSRAPDGRSPRLQ